MANVNNNLSSAYSTWKNKTNLEAQMNVATDKTEKNALQQQINTQNNELNKLVNDKTLWDITNDGTITYKDIIEFASGVDLDGDGEVTQSEIDFINAMAQNITKNYNVNNDNAAKNADLTDLSNFMTAIERRGDIYTSNNELDIKLEEINENLNANLLGATTQNNISEQNVKALANLELQRDSVKAYLADEMDETSAKLLFGSDLSRITESYANELETAIKSLQQQIGIPNGNTNSLSTNDKKNYDNYRAKCTTTTWEEAAIKQRLVKNENGNYYFKDVNPNANITYDYDINKDGNFDYKDFMVFANGDIDGNGKVSAAEKKVINEMSSNISKNYNVYRDNEIKNADLEDLSNFMSAIENRGDIYASTNELDVKLEDINKQLNKNLFGTDSGISKNNLNLMVQNQNKLDVAKALLNNEISTETAQKFLGEDVSKVDANYVKNLEAQLKSIQMNIGIKDGDTSSLNSNQLNNYNTLYEKALLSNPTLESIIKAEEVIARADENLKAVLEDLPLYEQALLPTIDLTATFDSKEAKYVIAKSPVAKDGKYHIFAFADDSGTLARAVATETLYETGVLHSNFLSITVQKDKTGGLDGNYLVYVKSDGTKEVDTGVIDPETLLDPTKPADAIITRDTGVLDKSTLLDPTKDPDALVPTGNKIWVDAVYETVAPSKTDDEIKDAREAAEMELGEELGNAINRDGSENRKETANKCKEVVSAATKEYKSNNITKQTFINVIHTGLTTAIGTEKANEFTRVLNTIAQAEADNIDKTIAGSLDNYIDKLLKIIDSTKPTQKLVSEGHYEDEIVPNNKYAKNLTEDVRNDVKAETIKETVSGYTSDISDNAYTTWDPLAFDTNGNGIKTSNEKVKFDIDGDGKLDLINDSADAVLVFDADGNGIAGESGLEVFGDNTDLDGDGVKDGFKNGFDALRALGEKEGLLGGDDLTLDEEDIAKLQEKYGLGLKSGYLGETQSLSDIGVTEINFGKSNETQTIKNFDGQGNDLMTQEGATFKLKNRFHSFADIWHRLYEEDKEEEEK